MNLENIIKFLKEINAKRIKQTNNWVMCSCLFSRDHPKNTDNKPSFGISISNPSYYHCFTCGRKGMLYEIQPLLRQYNLDKDNKAYNIIRTNESFEFKLVETNTPKTSGIIPYYQYEKYNRPNKSYLKIPIELYDIWDIREHNEYIFIPIFDNFNRLIDIKIRNKYNKLIGNNRFVMPSENFYPDLQRINGVGAKNHGIWFGIHRYIKDKPVFLVEGERDAILLSKYFQNTLASMGASITKTQIKSLLQIDTPIILFFDNDDAGNKASELIKNQLNYKELYSITNYYNCKDPAEIIEKNLLKKVIYSIKKI